ADCRRGGGGEEPGGRVVVEHDRRPVGGAGHDQRGQRRGEGQGAVGEGDVVVGGAHPGRGDRVHPRPAARVGRGGERRGATEVGRCGAADGAGVAGGEGGVRPAEDAGCVIRRHRQGRPGDREGAVGEGDGVVGRGQAGGGDGVGADRAGRGG